MPAEPPFWPKIIRALRNRQGASQAAFGERLGVDQTTVSRWERGLDEPRIGLRRQLLDMYRKGGAGRQDQVAMARVRNAFWPTSLVRPGAVFVEISQPALFEVGLSARDLRGVPIYGLFGAGVDEATERWEASGIFGGEIAMTISVNEIGGPDGPAYVKTMDTPHFTSHGEIWCLCAIKRIGEDEYAELKTGFGGSTLVVPFESLRE